MNNKYRATLNGFWCRTASRDNVGNWDGKGDEVMFVTTTRVVAPDGTVRIDLSSESEVHGDTWNLPNRVQAGSAWGGYGGIVTGDRFPTPTPWRMTQPVNTRLSPPYTLWEGDLAAGGDSVFLSPTVWEWDDGTSAWEIYRAWLASTDSRFGKQAKEAYGTIWQAAKPIFDIVSIGLQTAQTMTGFWGLYKEARRPIGLARDPEDSDNAIFNPLVIGLNAESAEWLATNNLHGLGNGIVELRYADDPWLAGVYSIFVQISRVSVSTPSPPTFEDGTLVREISRPEVYVVFGRAKFHVPDPATLERLYGPWSAVQVVPDRTLDRVPIVPVDGTLLREEHSPNVWRIDSGQKRHVTSPAVLRRFGGWGMVRIVHDNALSSTRIPTGTPLT